MTARKAGLSLAIGDYIGFVDGDDYIESTFYENLLDKIFGTSADFIYSGFIQEDKGYSKICAPSSERMIVSKEKLLLLKNYLLCFDNENETWSPSIWSKLFKSDFIRKCYNNVPNSQSYGEDLHVFCRCILESDRFIVTTIAKYHYLLREDSISHKWDISKFYQECNLYNELCNICREYGYYGEMEEYMNKYLFLRMINCMNQVNKIGLGVVKYIIPDMDILDGKDIIVYGGGKVGRDYMSQLLVGSNCRVLSWADSELKKTCIQYVLIKNK